MAEEETAPVEQPELAEQSTPAPSGRKRSPDGEVCGLCWPEGWPEDTAAATCLHGSWTK